MPGRTKALALAASWIAAAGGLNRLEAEALRLRRRQLLDHVLSAGGDKVQAGPFAGMRVSPYTSWGDGDLVPKLLGTYEQELHPAIERLIRASPPVVVNLGCAEGYYAVGIKYRLPGSNVLAVDTKARALDVTNWNAYINRLQVTTASSFVVNDVPPGSALIVDVEGAELEYLAARDLESFSILVECHDFIRPGAEQILCQRFAATHTITRIQQGSRDPNRIPVLREMSESARWAAVNERRPCAMSWLEMTPTAGL